jgi:hypothetical protein
MVASGVSQPVSLANVSGRASREWRLPLGSLLHDRFLRLIGQGGSDLDWSALGGLSARDAGTKFEAAS